MSSGCRVTNALDISVQFSRYTGIFVFWNALPAAGSEHRLSQTVHCRSPGMTIAGFFRFVLITEFTPFLQDLCFISYDGFKLDFLVFQEASLYRLLSLRDGATIKLPPPKTPSQSSQPSRGRVSTAVRSVIGPLGSSEIGVYILDGCPSSAPTDGFRTVVSFGFVVTSPFHSIGCLRSKNLYSHLLSGMQKVVER